MPIHKHPVALPHTNGRMERLPLDARLVDELRSSYALVRSSHVRLAEIFYAKLFAAAPGLRPLFREEPESQQRKLMHALDAVVHNLSSPETNAALLKSLGERHATYGAKPEHYDLVIDLLVVSIEELLGSRATKRILDDWRVALRLVSQQMIAAAEGATAQERPRPSTGR